MKKQKFIGIIIGVLIFVFIVKAYMDYKSYVLKELIEFDEEYYEKFLSSKSSMILDYDNILSDNRIQIDNIFWMALDSAEITKNQIKLNIELSFDKNIVDEKSIKFSYYMYDNNNNIIANSVHTRKSKYIMPYFYEENQREIDKSYENYFWYINENYNTIQTNHDEVIYDIENGKCNFIIDKRNENGFIPFDSLEFVLYDFTYNTYFYYDPSDESKIEMINYTLDEIYKGITIRNISL